MELFTYRPITFLLNFSAGSFSPINKKDGFTVISINNKNFSLMGVIIVALRRQQKRIGLLISKNILNKISQYILVGKDKSVVNKGKMLIPTISVLQRCCG